MSVFVTDTHGLLWRVAGRDSRPGPGARRAFDAVDRGVAGLVVPFAVIWEIGILTRLNRVRLSCPFEEWVRRIRQMANVSLAAAEPEHAVVAASQPWTGEPFDDLIIATARAFDAPLITADERITASRLVDVVWA